MAQDKKLWQSKHFWYSITPLLATLFTIVLINWVWPGAVAESPATPTSPTAVAAQTNTFPATATRPPILRATILPSPAPSRTPLPDLAALASITLLGPPPESAVAANGRLAFYWTYSETLLPDQQFVLSLWQNDAIVATETITQPNLGNGFQLLVDLEAAAILPGTAVWQLHLEWADEPQQLLTSEQRTIILLPE